MLTEIQKNIATTLAGNRNEHSYAAGGATILQAITAVRYSQDIDLFHDSIESLRAAFELDVASLTSAGFEIDIVKDITGHIKAEVKLDNKVTFLEWAHDAMYRFMPIQESSLFGWQLHLVDSATNKVLALAGREEPRDVIDTIYLHEHFLPLGCLIWAAVDKDPGFSPSSMLELIRRRGRLQPYQLATLGLDKHTDVVQVKQQWLSALADAQAFIEQYMRNEPGCLYWNNNLKKFVDPRQEDYTHLHTGSVGGSLPGTRP